MEKKTIYINDVILKKPNLIEPCLVQFVNGSLKSEASERITGSLFRTPTDSEIPQAVKSSLVISSPKMNYVGKNLFESHKKGLQDRFFLGILDKETGQMNLIEASNFVVQPALNEPVTKQGSSIKESNAKSAFQDNRMAEFGGKKARTRIRKREMAHVDLDTMSGAFENAAENAQQLELGREDNITFNDILPPCDRDAKRIENVYSLSSIIEDEELMEYKDMAWETVDEGVKENKKSVYSMLFTQTLATTKLNFPDDNENLIKFTCANLYMNALIFLLKLRKKSFSSKDFKELNCPSYIMNKIVENFAIANNNLRKKTKQLEDKLSCYIIVLALILNSYEVSLSILLQSLGLEKARLEKLIKVVGATVTKSTVILQFPLSQLSFIQKKRKTRR